METGFSGTGRVGRIRSKIVRILISHDIRLTSVFACHLVIPRFRIFVIRSIGCLYIKGQGISEAWLRLVILGKYCPHRLRGLVIDNFLQDLLTAAQVILFGQRSVFIKRNRPVRMVRICHCHLRAGCSQYRRGVTLCHETVKINILTEIILNHNIREGFLETGDNPKVIFQFIRCREVVGPASIDIIDGHEMPLRDIIIGCSTVRTHQHILKQGRTGCRLHGSAESNRIELHVSAE